MFSFSDLFKHYDTSPFLGIALEDALICEDSVHNAKWIINAYGNDIYQELKDERIICVGTVWGSADEFMKYSQVMAEILNSEWCARLNIVEQGVGNYIISRQDVC